ncbi:MAG: SRPBCC family protein [Thermoanaerobaculaceae bacterium]|jgi:hypothetical protein
MTDRFGSTVDRTYTQHIEAPPERVFPLLCPVRETEWLDGWSYEMIHSESGVAEDGCVFRTGSDGFHETMWMVTRHSPGEGVVEFVRVTTGLAATRLRIALEPAPGGATAVHIRYTHTPTTTAGAAFIDAHFSPAEFERSMAWWERSMNHFIATGRILRRE